MAAQDKTLIWCNVFQSVNLEQFEQFIDNYRQGIAASCSILSRSMAFDVYAVSYDPNIANGDILVSSYDNTRDGRRKVVEAYSGIYDRETDFIIHSDIKTLVLSKSNRNVTFLEGYDTDKPLVDGGLSLDQAKALAEEVNERYTAYGNYCSRLGTYLHLNALGMVIPDSFTAEPSPSRGRVSLAVTGAVTVDDKLCYNIEMLLDGEFHNQYYVEAREGAVVYNVSMVDGTPVPVYCMNQAYITNSK